MYDEPREQFPEGLTHPKGRKIQRSFLRPTTHAMVSCNGSVELLFSRRWNVNAINMNPVMLQSTSGPPPVMEFLVYNCSSQLYPGFKYFLTYLCSHTLLRYAAGGEWAISRLMCQTKVWK